MCVGGRGGGGGGGDRQGIKTERERDCQIVQ